jgi:hypothetical protein
MGTLILIIPTLAFDVWLGATVGKRQVQRWTRTRAWTGMAGVCAAGLALAILCLVFIQYHWDAKTRVIGFPIPMAFFNLEDQTWVRSTTPKPWLYLAGVTNVASGLAMPLIPYKIAEFIQMLKRELNR